MSGAQRPRSARAPYCNLLLRRRTTTWGGDRKRAQPAGVIDLPAGQIRMDGAPWQTGKAAGRLNQTVVQNTTSKPKVSALNTTASSRSASPNVGSV